MKRIVIAATAAILMTTTTHAGNTRRFEQAEDVLPKIFHGAWCFSTADNLRAYRPCPAPDTSDEITITSKGFEGHEMSCQLTYLIPVKNTRRDVEYRAMFTCMSDEGKATKAWHAYYWIGFYDHEHDAMFMNEANHGGFTGPKINN